MKSSILIIALLLWSSSFSQNITLPTYQEGQYEFDTVYTYYGDLPFTGIGNIEFGGALASGFITGVDFKIIIDSTNQGPSPIHAAFRDSLGVMVPVYKNDTLSIPASLELFAGFIGFRIIIEGTPQIAGETYLCDLGYMFTTGNDWGMIISENTGASCTVSQFNQLNQRFNESGINVFPNPFSQNTIIEIEDYRGDTYDCIIYDLQGKKVSTKSNISSRQFTIDGKGLIQGTYIVKLYLKEHTISKRIVFDGY